MTSCSRGSWSTNVLQLQSKIWLLYFNFWKALMSPRIIDRRGKTGKSETIYFLFFEKFWQIRVDKNVNHRKKVCSQLVKRDDFVCSPQDFIKYEPSHKKNFHQCQELRTVHLALSRYKIWTHPINTQQVWSENPETPFWWLILTGHWWEDWAILTNRQLLAEQWMVMVEMISINCRFVLESTLLSNLCTINW